MVADELSKQKKVLDNCNFVKTILMLLVIFGHACAFWTGGWFTEIPTTQSKGLNFICTWIGSFHIYAFVLVSGYIFASKIMGGGVQSLLAVPSK